MHCYTINDEFTITDGIEPHEILGMPLDETITDASVRMILGADWETDEFVRQVTEGEHDVLLHTATSLIPDTGPSNTFPEGSFLIRMPANMYHPEDSDNSLCAITYESMMIVGCRPETTLIRLGGADCGTYLVNIESKPELEHTPAIVAVDDMTAYDNQDVTIFDA